MPSKPRLIIIFCIIQIASLTALSFITTCTIFSSNSGWQFGFGVLLSIQEGVLALISTLVFGVSLNIYELTLSYTKSAISSVIIVIFSLFLSLPFGFFIDALGGFWLFHILVLINAFLVPYFISWKKANKAIKSDS